MFLVFSEQHWGYMDERNPLLSGFHSMIVMIHLKQLATNLIIAAHVDSTTGGSFKLPTFFFLICFFALLLGLDFFGTITVYGTF